MLFDPLPAGARVIGERYRSIQLRSVLSTDGAAVMSLAVIWAFAELLIRPYGEFPLNDDWSYTLSLQQWYSTHHYHLTGWTSMPLLTQLAWGMAFCKVFGEAGHPASREVSEVSEFREPKVAGLRLREVHEHRVLTQGDVGALLKVLVQKPGCDGKKSSDVSPHSLLPAFEWFVGLRHHPRRY